MKIIAVNGYKAVGRNMTGISVGRETIALDNGIRLDTMQMYDSELRSLKSFPIKKLIEMDILTQPDRLKNVIAQVVSHAHLDHYGSIPFHKPKVPIISTHYTNELIKKDYKEGNYISLNYGERYEISKNFELEFIEISHSIPYSAIVVLYTKEGIVVYASDFKLDNFSNINKPDYKSLKKLGKEGVKALIAESVRVKEKGKTPSEIVVIDKLRDIFSIIDDGLIIVATFSTHMERIGNIIKEAENLNRKIIIMGRSLLKNISVARSFNLFELKGNIKVVASSKAIKNSLTEIKRGKRDEYLLIVTGHQGEPDSILSRMASDKLPFRFQKGDSVIFCSDVIPSPINFASRYALETKLRMKKVKIFDSVHVSGHASREDHRYLIKLLKPEHIIPCHGDIEMRSSYAELCLEEGYELQKSVHILRNGSYVKIR